MNERFSFRSSPVLVSRHTLLINRPGQLLGVREDVVVVQDDRFDDLIHMRLTGHLVQRVRRGQEGGAEYDGQVPSIHHVLIAVLGKAAGEEGKRYKPQFYYEKHFVKQGDNVLVHLEQSSSQLSLSTNNHVCQSLDGF